MLTVLLAALLTSAVVAQDLGFSELYINCTKDSDCRIENTHLICIASQCSCPFSDQRLVRQGNFFVCTWKNSRPIGPSVRYNEILVAVLIAIGCFGVAIVCIMAALVVRRISSRRNHLSMMPHDIFNVSEEFRGLEKPPSYVESERATYGVPPPDYTPGDVAWIPSQAEPPDIPLTARGETSTAHDNPAFQN